MKKLVFQNLFVTISVLLFMTCSQCVSGNLINKDDLIDNQMDGEIFIFDSNKKYSLVDVDYGQLYTDREYSIARNLPAFFQGWVAATTTIKAKNGGYIKRKTDGKVYIMTRPNRSSIMLASGWVAETPTEESSANMIRETSGSGLIIWSKLVSANQQLAIPITHDSYFGGFIPIARKISIPGLADITVQGELVDIRPLRENSKVYPQNNTDLFTSIPSDLKEMKYATSLKNSMGVKQFSADQETTIYLAINANTDFEGWTKTNREIGVGSLYYKLYTYKYQNPNEWIDVPTQVGVTGSLLLGERIKVKPKFKIPGTVIAKVSNLGTNYLVTNPNIIKISSNTYLASCYGTLGGRGTAFYLSEDRGLSWRVLSSNDGVSVNFDKLFILNAVLYQLGTAPQNLNSIVIRKSLDNGLSWSPLSVLFDDEDYLAAPTPVTICDGRVWHSMSTIPQGRTKGSFVISAPLDSDLMDAKNWVASNSISWDKGWLPPSFINWQEGNTVVDLEGNLVVLMRIDESNFPNPLHDKAAIIRVKDSQNITFAPEQDIIDFPGGSKKFTIDYDSNSKKYWALTNPCFDEDLNKKQEGIYENGISGSLLRNRLCLISSSDFINWTIEHTLISSDNPFFHGFQYVDWVFDGDDIIAVIRMAFDEERGLPARQHDANIFTFLRVKNFRNSSLENATIEIIADNI